jgi:hypothetical protein
MKIEPVAWLINGKLFEEYFRTSELDEIIPVYPHPVKELSDERIKQIFADETGFDFDDNPGDGMALMDFVRAVLKESREI